MTDERLPKVAQCPSTETMAAYLDSRLDSSTRSDVEAHLATCEACYELLIDSSRTDTEAFGERPPATRGLPPHIKWIGLALLAASVVMLVRLVPAPSRSRAVVNAELPEFQELVTALNAEPTRPAAGRLSGPFVYAPAPSASRSSSSAAIAPDVRIAAAALEKRALEDDRPENLAAVGVGFLALGQLDAAVNALQRAVDGQPANAQFASDLAAVLLTRAERMGIAEDWPRALAACERALASDNASPFALFNRAVALEGLELRDQAVAAWDAYLARDGSSPWATEAKRRRDGLGATAGSAAWDTFRGNLLAAAAAGDRAGVLDRIGGYREAARELLEDNLLPRLAASDGATDRSLPTSAVTVGDAISELESDPFSRESAGIAAGIISRRNRPRERELLAGGYEACGSGKREYAAYAFRLAQQSFTRCQKLLSQVHSPYALWAELQGAIVDYQLRRIASAEVALARIVAAAEARSYRILAARAHWILGSIHANAARFDRADFEYRQARNHFDGAGEAENVANVDVLLAENKALIGEQREGWKLLISAFRQFRQLRDPSRRQAMTFVGAFTSLRQNMPEVARVYQDAYLAETQLRGAVGPIAEGLVRRAEIYARLEQLGPAAKDLDTVRAMVPGLDPSQAAWVRTLVAEAEAAVLRPQAQDRTVALLDQAIGYAKSAGREGRLPQLYLQRGRANRDLERIAEAEGDLQTGIEWLERLRGRMSTDATRLSYFDRGWELYGDLSELQLARGDGVGALATTESGRARRLAERSGAAGHGLAPESVGSDLDGETTVVFYATLPTSLVAWTLSDSGWRSATRPIAAVELGRVVDRFRTAIIERDSAAVERFGRQLYTELIGPIEQELRQAHHLIVVPDGSLHSLPFAALDTGRGTYLIEEWSVSVASSLAALNRLQKPRSQTSSAALVVVNPQVADAFVALPKLRDAAHEGREVASQYPSARILDGGNATKAAFLRHLAEVDVVHFAGHAVPVPSYPNLSQLLFASQPGRPSEHIGATEISGLDLSHTELVVLAACRTGIGTFYRGEGPLSLARPFMLAGAQAVVATLWEAEDASARVLFREFHTAFRLGRATGRALREAQLALLRSGDPRLEVPAAWAVAIAFSAR